MTYTPAKIHCRRNTLSGHAPASNCVRPAFWGVTSLLTGVSYDTLAENPFAIVLEIEDEAEMREGHPKPCQRDQE